MARKTVELRFPHSAALMAALAAAACLVVAVGGQTRASAQALAAGGAVSGRPRPSAAKHCPKILMFDGLEIHHDVTEEKARYWGETVGIDGFFVNHVMTDWQDSVGTDPRSPIYQRVEKFQKLYSRYGVSDNFIKSRPYRSFNWLEPGIEDKVAANFEQAARLAEHAGLRGVALDLEPNNDIWEKDPHIPNKARRAYELGRKIGLAISAGCPNCEVIAIMEALWMEKHGAPPNPKFYLYSPDFWHGLLKAHPHRLHVAIESTYGAVSPYEHMNEIASEYKADADTIGVDRRHIRITPGFWPLGKSYTDKSARWTAAQWKQGLSSAMALSKDYVWIYGAGSAWESEGAYGKGKVDPRFSEFTKVIHEVKRACGR